MDLETGWRNADPEDIKKAEHSLYPDLRMLLEFSVVHFLRDCKMEITAVLTLQSHCMY